jgi:uncharacterized protein
MSNSNAQLIREMYRSFQGGDLNGVLNQMADDITWNAAGVAPFAGLREGRDHVREFFTEMSQTVAIEHFAVDNVIADADKVVVLGRERMRVNTTGRNLEFSFAHVYTIRDRKVIKANLFNDSTATAADFGMSTRAAG